MEIEVEGGGLELELSVKDWRGVVTLAGIALLGAAIARELGHPPHERTWHGRLFGMLPYDLRPPTPERLRATLWNPDNASLLVPTVFGVGWSVNVAALPEVIRSLAARRTSAGTALDTAPTRP